MTIVKKFCSCFQLKSGAIVIGLISIIYAIVFTIITTLELSDYGEWEVNLGNATTTESIDTSEEFHFEEEGNIFNIFNKT